MTPAEAFALLRAADARAVCADVDGVTVTCGAHTTAGKAVREVREVADAHGALMQVVGVTLTIPAGLLGAPARAATVVLATGPLAGRYQFRQLLDGPGDGTLDTWLLRPEAS